MTKEGIYNPWPLGSLPEGFERPEIKIIMDKYPELKDARDIVDLFERTIAEFTGAPYAVAVDSCTDALFLICKYQLRPGTKVTIPARTYISVPQSIIQAGSCVEFTNYDWQGMYLLQHKSSLAIYDSAPRFTKDMYKNFVDTEMALSFQIKKRLPIGKGGMILTDDLEAYNWYKKARYEGRDLTIPYDKDSFDMVGWNMYMCPEDAARGLILFEKLLRMNPGGIWPDMWNSSNYPNLMEKNVLNKWGYE